MGVAAWCGRRPPGYHAKPIRPVSPPGQGNGAYMEYGVSANDATPVELNLGFRTAIRQPVVSFGNKVSWRRAHPRTNTRHTMYIHKTGQGQSALAELVPSVSKDRLPMSE